MLRTILAAVTLILLVSMAVYWWATFPKNGSFDAAGDTASVVEIGGKRFVVELAQTPEEHAAGLSNRIELAADAGMLFVFDQPVQPSFWMREMNFPLDMVWLDEKLTVVEVTRNAPIPMPDQSLEELPLYSPPKEIRYVLEVNAGQAATVRSGQQALLRTVNEQ